MGNGHLLVNSNLKIFLIEPFFSEDQPLGLFFLSGRQLSHRSWRLDLWLYTFATLNQLPDSLKSVKNCIDWQHICPRLSSWLPWSFFFIVFYLFTLRRSINKHKFWFYLSSYGYHLVKIAHHVHTINTAASFNYISCHIISLDLIVITSMICYDLKWLPSIKWCQHGGNYEICEHTNNGSIYIDDCLWPE